MNQTNDLASGPDTVVWVTIDKDLTTALAANIWSNLGKIASRALLLDLQSVLGDLVREQAGSILPPAQNKRGIGLLGLDDSLLDILVNGSLDGAHEAGTHVDTLGAESQGSGQTIAVGETARGNERHTQILASAAQEDKVGDIVLADVAGALKSVNGEEIHTQLHGGLGMADGSALVEDDNAGLLELLDNGTGVVSSGLNDLDALVNDDLGVGTVVGRYHGREESQVDTEGVLGHFAASSDFLAQVFRGGLGEGSQLEGGY